MSTDIDRTTPMFATLIIKKMPTKICSDTFPRTKMALLFSINNRNYFLPHMGSHNGTFSSSSTCLFEATITILLFHSNSVCVAHSFVIIAPTNLEWKSVLTVPRTVLQRAHTHNAWSSSVQSLPCCGHFTISSRHPVYLRLRSHHFHDSSIKTQVACPHVCLSD